MDLLLGSVIFGIVGLMTTAIWDIDLPKLYADISFFFLICIIIFFNLNNNIVLGEKIIITIFDTIPSLIIGDIVGSFLLKFKEFLKF